MNNLAFFWVDIGGLIIATLLAAVLLILPGYALAAAIKRWCGLDLDRWAPMLGLFLLPWLDAILIRVTGIWSAVGLHGLLAVFALAFAHDRIARPSGLAITALLAWWVYCASLQVDFDWGGQLNQSLLVLDMVKHAAVVREIAENGLPLQDPFVLRSENAGYYHYFYDAAALLDRAGGTLVSPRMAFAAGAFWIGALFPLLLRNLVQLLGWQRGSDRRLLALCIGLSMIAGLDLLGVLLRWSTIGIVEANAEWWDDEISFVMTAASWVPHHLQAVMASVFGIALLAQARDDALPQPQWIATCGISGLAFASTFGLSVWVALAAGIVMVASLRVLLGDRAGQWLTSLAIAGLVAGLVSIPQLLDLMSGRAPGAFPLGIWIREPARAGELLGFPIPAFAALLATPLVWAVEFGLFAFGAWLFSRDPTFARDRTMARVLVAMLVTGLLLNLLVRSTLINNDFGWRSVWFASIAAMVWTVTVLQHPPVHRPSRLAVFVLAGFGLAATAYNLVAARIVRPPLANTSFAYINAKPALDLSLRRAYEWAAANLPRDAVLQHNPASARRVFAFGLYGVHRTALADAEADLFGADRRLVKARGVDLARLFAGALPVSEANRHEIDYLVVVPTDAIWNQVRPHCAWADRNVCIVAITALSETKP